VPTPPNFELKPEPPKPIFRSSRLRRENVIRLGER
jgi:hypothetical protein